MKTHRAFVSDAQRGRREVGWIEEHVGEPLVFSDDEFKHRCKVLAGKDPDVGAAAFMAALKEFFRSAALEMETTESE